MNFTVKRVEVDQSVNNIEFFFYAVKRVIDSGLSCKLWQQQENGIKIPILVCQPRSRQDNQDKVPFKPLCILVPALFNAKVDPNIYKGYGLPVFVIKPPLKKLDGILNQYKELYVQKKPTPAQEPSQPYNVTQPNAPRPSF